MTALLKIISTMSDRRRKYGLACACQPVTSVDPALNKKRQTLHYEIMNKPLRAIFAPVILWDREPPHRISSFVADGDSYGDPFSSVRISRREKTTFSVRGMRLSSEGRDTKVPSAS
jgi:hypothetical protein